MIGSRKTITAWLGTPVFVGFLGYCAPLAAQELYGPLPSTVAYERIYYEVPSGEQRGIEQSVFAVRSDGATCEAVRRRAPDGQEITVRTIRDPARKAMIGIDESTRSLVTFGLYPDEVRRLRLPRASCPPGVPDPTVTILGYRTQHIRFEVPCTECEAGPGFIRRTLDKWVSPELGCLPLRVVHGFIAGDGRLVLSSVREAKAVVLGEPDAALFDIPNYPERSPSQVIREFERKYGLPPLEKPFADLEFHDRRYEESRKQLRRDR